MYSFKNDYSHGCHPSILQKLAETNLEQQDGYGADQYSQEARECIKKKMNSPDSEVYFVSGGTQANLIVIAATLRPHESVICAHTGHIHVHEAGSIEATGHKINTISSDDGKLRISDIQSVLDAHKMVPHMVKPKMVYISNSTEVGTIYTKQELEQLSSYCKDNSLYLFLDGARLGSALCAQDNDLTLADVARLTDMFYIGGTKNGALLGEAIVINTVSLQADFAFHLKQRGALLSKGRLLGIQFLELFRDNLFFDLAQHANTMAMKLTQGLQDQKVSFLTASTSNQIFPILPDDHIATLSQKYGFYIWKKVDDIHSAIRLITSRATDEKMVDQFINDLKKL